MAHGSRPKGAVGTQLQPALAMKDTLFYLFILKRDEKFHRLFIFFFGTLTINSIEKKNPLTRLDMARELPV